MTDKIQYTLYPNQQSVVDDIRRIANKTGQKDVGEELILEILRKEVEAVGFGYFGERGTLVFYVAKNYPSLIIHAVYSHDIGLTEAALVAEELAIQRNCREIRCTTKRPGLASKLVRLGWTAILSKTINRS